MGEFNQPLKEGIIPKSVTYLTLGSKFNKYIHDNIYENLIELLLYNTSMLSEKDNVLIGYNDCKFIRYNLYNKYNIKLKSSDKYLFDNYILNIDLNKLKGKIIIKELVEKVFNPQRLLNICNNYHIDFVDLVDIYS